MRVQYFVKLCSKMQVDLEASLKGSWTLVLARMEISDIQTVEELIKHLNKVNIFCALSLPVSHKVSSTD